MVLYVDIYGSYKLGEKSPVFGLPCMNICIFEFYVCVFFFFANSVGYCPKKKQ